MVHQGQVSVGFKLQLSTEFLINTFGHRTRSLLTSSTTNLAQMHFAVRVSACISGSRSDSHKVVHTSDGYVWPITLLRADLATDLAFSVPTMISTFLGYHHHGMYGHLV